VGIKGEKMKFELYKTMSPVPQWAWRLLATNGKIVAIGGESFHNFSDMASTLRQVFGTSLKRSIELEKAVMEARKKAIK
jgi:hypothetical protein